MALLRCTLRPVRPDTRRLVWIISLVLIPVVKSKESRRGWRGMTTPSKAAVPAPPPNAVDGTLHLVGPGPDGGKAVGGGETEVVMAVNAETGLAHVFYLFFEVTDEGGVLLRDCIAHGVRYVHGSGTGLYDGLYHLLQEGQLCPG